MTPNAIGAFQASGKDWAGKPLTVDRALGPRTAWALAIADLPRYRRAIVERACARAGIAESPVGSNRGPEIDVWLANVGASPGDPWCAAFVYAVLAQTGVEAKAVASARLCLAQYPECVHPLPGDVFGWVNAGGTGHVGFVIGFTAEGVATVEGNSANGVRVCSRPIAGLSFRRVPNPCAAEIELAPVTGAPVVQRAKEGTR